ncbi:5266_t:CDS:2 [Ambispora gerdemannii]|uniref:5266_t:CDS:1 n=1 Tax=Ambispora gerdemannii TaxID=144530 RepID=A0A9N8VE93_9GLOM|nr:5266_t:CDS:2 [Ambispora gerdemannii]
MLRKVVTSFLIKPQHNGLNPENKVLLLRRSDKVRTYPHHWAGISGSIEAGDKSPLERALNEIKEETKFTSSDVKLIRTGKPFTIRAENISTVWKVYPFLFHLLASPDKIQLDWEHETSQWMKPNEIYSLENTVPRLEETFYRVYLPENVHRGLKDMCDNRSSGAQQLADQALGIFAESVESRVCYEYCNDARELYLTWLNIGWHIIQIRPTMRASISCAITSVLKQLKNSIEHKNKNALPSVEDFEKLALDKIHEQRELSLKSNERIIDAFRKAIKIQDQKFPENIHIMTLSYSSTIYNALANIINSIKSSSQNPKIEITILESRPLNEGAVVLAQKLSSLLIDKISGDELESVRLQIVSDASCDYFMSTVTHVLLGADRIIGNDGAVINKMGSVPLALASKHHEKPVFVISRTDKISACEEAEQMEENDPKEVTAAYGNESEKNLQSYKPVKVRNVYFEKVESSLIDHYVTENGLLKTRDIQELWEGRKTDEEIFNELQ